jgi:hypothetical protein
MEQYLILNNPKIKYPIQPLTNGCHIIPNKPTDRDGYYRYQDNTKQRRTSIHRKLYELYYNKTLPNNIVVRHLCNNPSCININHLKEGTQKENIADREASDKNLRGTNNGRVKLTKEQVKQIYLSNKPINELRKEYGLAHATIRAIIIGKNWGWLTKELTTETI